MSGLTWGPFQQCFMNSQSKFSWSNLDFNNSIRPQICTCHDSSAVMACAKLWHDQTIILHITVTHIVARFGLWAHKRLAWDGPLPYKPALRCLYNAGGLRWHMVSDDRWSQMTGEISKINRDKRTSAKEKITVSCCHSVYLSTFIWINSPPPSAAYMCHWIRSALVQIMPWRLFGAKALSKPILAYCQLDGQEQTSVKFETDFYHFY